MPQGEIREKFEQEKIKSETFSKQILSGTYKSRSISGKKQRKLKTIFDYLEEKYAIEARETQLGRFRI